MVSFVVAGVGMAYMGGVRNRGGNPHVVVNVSVCLDLVSLNRSILYFMVRRQHGGITRQPV